APDRPIPEPSREHVLEHRRALYEVELLEDHPHPPPDPAQRRAPRGGDLDAVEQDATARRLDEAVEATEQRRLPGPREPDENDELAARDVEGDAVECACPARVNLREVLDGEDGRHLVAGYPLNDEGRRDHRRPSIAIAPRALGGLCRRWRRRRDRLCGLGGLAREVDTRELRRVAHRVVE